MSAQVTASSFLNESLRGIKNRLYQFATGKAAPGTLEREANDLLARKFIEKLRTQQTLTPQEERQQELDFVRGLSEIQQKTNVQGVNALVPALLEIDRARTGTQTDAYVTRRGADTDAESRLTRERGEQIRRNTQAEYESYGSNLATPAFNLQRDLDTGSRELRGQLGNRMLDIFENSTNADIAYRNQLLDIDRQQNSGLRGFLNNLLPIAGLGLTAATLLRG